jgi:hypothetical protein
LITTHRITADFCRQQPGRSPSFSYIPDAVFKTLADDYEHPED